MNRRQSVAVFEVSNMSYNSIVFPLQSLTSSDVHLIASSVEHHPSLRELTVRECSESLVKGAVEGIARRHGVEILAVTQYKRGECL